MPLAFHSPSLPFRSRSLSSNAQKWRCSAAVPSVTTSSTSIKSDGKVVGVNAREILDSRGNPTVEVDLTTSDGVFRAAVPSGASTGAYEAHELRDGDKQRYGGKGVLKAVENINETIGPKILGMDVSKQESLDSVLLELDNSTNKSNLGANSILGVSMAVCMAGASKNKIPLYEHIANLAGKPAPAVMPVPFLNVINGGSHAGNNLAMQEFMIAPVGAGSFKEALRMGAETYAALKKVIKNNYGLDSTAVGDEGGFAPNVKDTSEGVELLMEAIKIAGFQGDIKLAMDVAASEFFFDGMYDLDFKNKNSTTKITPSELADLYKNLIKNYPLISIEDPFHEDDWGAYSKLTGDVGSNTQIVGDDLTVTNVERIARAVKEKSANALLLKINQIGSITEAISASNMAQKAGWGVMVSHRSGETEDAFIADLVVGLGVGQAKMGATCRSERLAKYNQLLRIESELGKKAIYAGKNFRDTSSLFS